MTPTVGDAFAEHLRLSPDAASSLRTRAAASGLDPGAAIASTSPDDLAAWLLVALAPNLSGPRALNDLGPCRSHLGRLSDYFAGLFSAGRTGEHALAFAATSQSDVRIFRDSDGAAAAVVDTAAHADGDERRLAPFQVAFAAVGARSQNLRLTATLPGHALLGVAMAAAGLEPDFIQRHVDIARESRIVRRAEGHRLTRSEGLDAA